MRVVAGASRGRRLVAPEGAGTRPTSDRVREAMFNALGSLDVVEGATVLDLFAGSGALGIEALSRGADHCTFVERDRRALDAVRANLAVTDLAGQATVVAGDVLGYLGRPAPVDLVLADPPYAFDGWADLVATIDPSATTLVIESDREIDLPSSWSAVRRKRYGGTLVLIARKPPDQAAGATPPNPSE